MQHVNFCANNFETLNISLPFSPPLHYLEFELHILLFRQTTYYRNKIHFLDCR